MPELPEVETIKNQLSHKIHGKKIKAVEIKLPKMIRGVSIKKFQQLVIGSTIKSITRRAKLLIINLSNGYSLVIHLKLTGQLIYMRTLKHSNIKTFTHIVYYFTDGSVLLHNDMRQFGWVRLIKISELEKYFEKENFGPEPLEKNFTLKKFKQLLSRKQRSRIKPLLMDQKFIAGIGNIYAQEACWCARILPTRPIKDLADKEIDKLYHCLIKILQQAIKYQGSSVDRYVDVSGEEGEYASKLKVYGRQSEKCLRCGTKIKKMTLAGRGTYYCPNCQK